MTTPDPEPLLTVRSALVFTLACLVAIAAAGLTFWKERSAPAACLAAGLAFAGGVMLFNSLITK